MRNFQIDFIWSEKLLQLELFYFYFSIVPCRVFLDFSHPYSLGPPIRFFVGLFFLFRCLGKYLLRSIIIHPYWMTISTKTFGVDFIDVCMMVNVVRKPVKAAHLMILGSSILLRRVFKVFVLSRHIFWSDHSAQNEVTFISDDSAFYLCIISDIFIKVNELQVNKVALSLNLVATKGFDPVLYGFFYLIFFYLNVLNHRFSNISCHCNFHCHINPDVEKAAL